MSKTEIAEYIKAHPLPRIPHPGDVVLVTKGIGRLLPTGTRGVIASRWFGDDGRASVCFNASAFRPDLGPGERQFVDCSGGPVPIVNLSELTFKGETQQRFWKFKDGRPGAGRGEDYTLTVNEWEWEANW